MALLYRMGTGNGSGGDLKPFIINFTCDSGFIGKTVTMEFQGTPHAGETVDNVSGTVASDGTLTLYPMHDGLWKYYATSDVSGYQEGTKTLEKWGNYPVELKDTPNGATVTPTDDVQTWLHCANVWNKSYTTISEVIADTTTLNILISDNNASDYLARSTTWASDVCSNESAMTYIGLNNYCANKLLADSTWSKAICNSAYSEKVLTVKVPTMTSNTSQVSASSEINGHEKYKAFDNVESTMWHSGGDGEQWIAYKFNNTIYPKIVHLIINVDFARIKKFKIQGSKDNNVWKDLTEELEAPASRFDKLITITKNYDKYQYLKFVGLEVHGVYRVAVNTLQFYGREEA